MSNLNSKCFLLEVFQKKGLKETDFVKMKKFNQDIKTLKHTFKMTMVLEEEEYTFESKPCAKKQEAEMSVWEDFWQLYQELDKPVSAPKKVEKKELKDFSSCETLIIIDYDNIMSNAEISKVEKVITKEMKIVKVASILSSTKNLADILVESTIKDATDCQIIFMIGQLSILSPNMKIIVWTKDHFGACLKDIYSNVKHAVDVESIISLLK